MILLLLRALSVSHQGASKLEGTVEDAAQVQFARPQAGQQGQGLLVPQLARDLILNATENFALEVLEDLFVQVERRVIFGLSKQFRCFLKEDFRRRADTSTKE